MTTPQTTLLEESPRFAGSAICSAASAVHQVRQAVELWGACRQARVTAYMTRFLVLHGLEDAGDRARDSVEFAVTLGEVERGTVHGQPWLMPTFPRLVQVSSSLQLVLGGGLEALQVESSDVEQWCVAGAARWLKSSREDVSELHAEVNYSEFELRDWVGEPGWAPILERLTGTRSGTLRALWECLKAAVANSRVRSDGPDRLRVVLGAPGEFFGGIRAERIEAKSGRWSGVEDLNDGLYVGARPGAVTTTRRPCVIQATGGELRLFDLWDWDELCWALLARGVHAGEPELVFRQHAGAHTVAAPAPRQVQRLLSCMGASDLDRRWTYNLASNLQSDVGRALSDLGLSVVTKP